MTSQCILAIQAVHREAKDAVLQYYEAYNRGDFDTVLSTMADQCSYHDMVYSVCPPRGVLRCAV